MSGPSTIATPDPKPAPLIIHRKARAESADVVYEGDSEEIIVARSDSRIPGKGATVAYAVTPKKQPSLTNASGSSENNQEDMSPPQNSSANKIQHTRKTSHPGSYNTLSASLMKKKFYELTSPSRKAWRQIFGDEQTWPLKSKEAKQMATANQDHSGMDCAGYTGYKMSNYELLTKVPGLMRSEVPSHGGGVKQVLIPVRCS
jgi:hypothetical protein